MSTANKLKTWYKCVHHTPTHTHTHDRRALHQNSMMNVKFFNLPFCSWAGFHSSVNLSTLTTILDEHRILSRPTLRADIFHLLHHIHTVDDWSKHNVLSIQPGSLCRAKKELWSIRVFTGVSHWEDSWSSVFLVESSHPQIYCRRSTFHQFHLP